MPNPKRSHPAAPRTTGVSPKNSATVAGNSHPRQGDASSYQQIEEENHAHWQREIKKLESEIARRNEAGFFATPEFEEMMFSSVHEMIEAMKPRTPELQFGKEQTAKIERNFASLLIAYLRIYDAVSHTAVGGAIGDGIRNLAALDNSVTYPASGVVSEFPLGSAISSVVNFATAELSELASYGADQIAKTATELVSTIPSRALAAGVSIATGALAAQAAGKSPAAGAAVGVAASLVDGASAKASNKLLPSTFSYYGLIFNDNIRRDAKGSWPDYEAVTSDISNQERYKIAVNRGADGFLNTLMHVLVVNHRYECAKEVLDSFGLGSKFPNALLKEVDANNRTAFDLALMVGAPEGACFDLMTESNVLNSDINGATPLMHAAVYGSPKLIERILNLVPEEKRAEYIKKKDNDGRTYLDYLNMSRDLITARFHKMMVDPQKDVNARSNILFDNDDASFGHEIADHQGDLTADEVARARKTSEKFSELGFVTTTMYFQKKTFIALLANKRNAALLRRLRDDVTKYQKFHDILESQFAGFDINLDQLIDVAHYDQGFVGTSLISHCMNKERRGGVEEVIKKMVLEVAKKDEQQTRFEVYDKVARNLGSTMVGRGVFAAEPLLNNNNNKER